MEIIPFEKKLDKEFLWAVKLTMPIKKFLRENYYQRKLNICYIGLKYDL
jgi:hypothetical protein